MSPDSQRDLVPNEVALVPTRVRIMGIVNVTPDSFSDGGRYLDPEAAIEHGLRLVAEGAHILDIGAESTRPGSQPTPLSDELARVLPVVSGLARRTNVLLSIDTQKSAVAERALALGATIVNDVSAARFDAEMLSVVARAGATYCAMHMRGTSRDMQTDPRYTDVVGEVLAFLRERTDLAQATGIARDKLWIDPGIGFGKTLAHNLELLRRLAELRVLGFPILIGLSRKGFIAKVDPRADDPMQRVGGTAAALTCAVQAGAAILRVHDVAIMSQAALVARAIAERG
jgi:dihydropteroate synthase